MVPKVSYWGFWGLVNIEKWSPNFDSDTQSVIFGTTKMPKITPILWPHSIVHLVLLVLVHLVLVHLVTKYMV